MIMLMLREMDFASDRKFDQLIRFPLIDLESAVSFATPNNTAGLQGISAPDEEGRVRINYCAARIVRATCGRKQVWMLLKDSSSREVGRVAHPVLDGSSAAWPCKIRAFYIEPRQMLQEKSSQLMS